MGKGSQNIRGLNIDDITLDEIYDFIDTRGENISPELAYYMELMEMVRDMDNRPMKYGSKEVIIKHLKKFQGLSDYTARKVYDDAIQYFYTQNSISKEAYRHRIAERQEKLINLGINMIKDVNDVIKLAKANADLVQILGLDKNDDFKMEEDEFLPPFTILSMNAKEMGIPTAVDKKELEKWVDQLPAFTEAQKELIKQESLIKPLKILPEENEDLRKH